MLHPSFLTRSVGSGSTQTELVKGSVMPHLGTRSAQKEIFTMGNVYGLNCSKQSICHSQIILGGTIVSENDAGLAGRMGYLSVVDTISQQKVPKEIYCVWIPFSGHNAG